MPNLGHASAGKWANTPIAYLIFTITETKKIILLRMEIEGHDVRSMPSVSLQTIAWLHEKQTTE